MKLGYDEEEIVLDFTYFPHPHYSVDIAETLLEILEDFGLKYKIISMTSDSAGNIVKALELVA